MRIGRVGERPGTPLRDINTLANKMAALRGDPTFMLGV